LKNLDREEKKVTKVLVVEDTPSELELVSTYLKDGGYSVVVAIDAKTAITKASEHKPDLIITDVVMPGMSGFELCRSLKNNPETKAIPIIICSSKNQEIDRLWGMKQGANFYLVKPFTKDDLIRAVRSLV
jgi:two-component system, chemotaxis family, response regulator PixH